MHEWSLRQRGAGEHTCFCTVPITDLSVSLCKAVQLEWQRFPHCVVLQAKYWSCGRGVRKGCADFIEGEVPQNRRELLQIASNSKITQ